MTLAINDTAPDFEAETTEGKIKFHDWIGNSWVVLFSHPKDFTPVCTTELGYMARIKPEFDKRGVKIIGLSVDPVDKHAGWAADIKETQGFAPNYPMIGDVDFNVSKLYGMLPASASGDPAKRTAADNQTVRNVFVIGPDATQCLLDGSIEIQPLEPKLIALKRYTLGRKRKSRFLKNAGQKAPANVWPLDYCCTLGSADRTFTK